MNNGTLTLEARIFDEQLRQLFASPTPYVINIINAAIVVAVLWPVLPPTATLAWFVALLSVIVVRLGLWRAFRVRKTAAAPATWARLHVIGTATTGALWGTTAVAIPLVDASSYDMFVGLVALGMSAGAVATSAYHLPSAYAFVIACLAPVAAMFAAEGDAAHVGLGAMGVLYAVGLVATVRRVNASLLETLRLRVRNTALATDLAVARDLAVAAERTNAETQAHLSHELRTPLNAIGGFAEMMRRAAYGPLGHPKYESYARDISDSARHLARLVDEILRYSKAHTSVAEIEEAVVDTTAELDSCRRLVADAASAEGVALVQDIAPDLPALRVDVVKLRQIVLNLLSNAIKFTPRGGRVTLAARCDAAGAIVVKVVDTGVGIERADLDRIMEPYVQIANALSSRNKGFGLGLPLAKRLAELHGGSIALESEPGRGTIVTVRFPPDRSQPRDAVQ